MNKLYQKIQQGIQYLPDKDKTLCLKFLEQRDFDQLYEIAESCLIMKKRDEHKVIHNDKWTNIDKSQLERLVLSTKEYMSYLDISDLSNDIEETFNE